jgi:hypothetical protein
VSAERWIVVRNWDRFQHYTDREPVWIKVYTELNSSDEWCELSLAARGLLVTLWVEYGRSRGQIRASAIPQLCRQKVLRKTLESLVDAGFIEVSASKPLAFARSREKSREETPKPPSRRKGADGRRITGWKRVRGSHGQTTIPDPFGTDPAPVG